MSIVTTGVAHIINAIKDLLDLIDSQHPLNISTDCDEKDNSFIKITFYLKNGKSGLRIYNNGGRFYYLDLNDKNLECVDFNDNNLSDTGGSFHKALKALITFDRQYSTKQVKNTDNLIDRASFGLAEVN
jgi:hypothetical protein